MASSDIGHLCYGRSGSLCFNRDCSAIIYKTEKEEPPYGPITITISQRPDEYTVEIYRYGELYGTVTSATVSLIVLDGWNIMIRGNEIHSENHTWVSDKTFTVKTDTMTYGTIIDSPWEEVSSMSALEVTIKATQTNGVKSINKSVTIYITENNVNYTGTIQVSADGILQDITV